MIICDEPVSALDVSVQAQVVNLLENLQDEFGLSYIFVAHDLSVVTHISDRVAVMYLGKMVELGTEDADLRAADAPLHPGPAVRRTRAGPDGCAGRREQIVLDRRPARRPADPPSGCRFRTRCWKAQDICAEQEPVLEVRGRRGPPVGLPLRRGQGGHARDALTGSDVPSARPGPSDGARLRGHPARLHVEPLLGVAGTGRHLRRRRAARRGAALAVDAEQVGVIGLVGFGPSSPAKWQATL